MDKKKLRLLIAENELEKAIKNVVKYTEGISDSSWHNEAVALSSQYAAYEHDLRMGAKSDAELKRNRNKVVGNMLGLVDDLPVLEANGEVGQKEGITEGRLKVWIGILLFAGKSGLILWVLFHLQTGGFSRTEARYTIGYLIPLFAAYLGVIVQENVRNRFRRNGKQALINKSLVWLTFTLIPAYLIAFYMTISARARGDISSTEELTTWLVIIESGLGIYVGTIVFELFNRKRNGH